MHFKNNTCSATVRSNGLIVFLLTCQNLFQWAKPDHAWPWKTRRGYCKKTAWVGEGKGENKLIQTSSLPQVTNSLSLNDKHKALFQLLFISFQTFFNLSDTVTN